MSMRPRWVTVRRTVVATAIRVLRIILKAVHREILKETLKAIRSGLVIREAGREAESSMRGYLVLGTRLRHHCRALDPCGLVGAGDDLFGLPGQFGPGARRHRCRAQDGGPGFG